MSDIGNIFADAPQPLPGEVVETLVTARSVRIERIMSRGECSPEGFWYDQEMHEWVLLLRGAARLNVEGEMIELSPCAYVNLPAHRKHRVEWTDPDQVTIWLAVYYE